MDERGSISQMSYHNANPRKRAKEEYIYSLGGRRGTWASALHCSNTGGAGCPGVGPDVRGFRRLRMSGPRRRMSGPWRLDRLGCC